MTPEEVERIERETKWLLANPHFRERPASIEEFFKEDYLNIDARIRPGIRKALVDIFGKEVSGDVLSQVRRAMITGAIGIGKTTFASIALPYMCHWVLCLKDPQGFYKLMPGSRIAFMQMSTSEKQATEVVFGDIFARIKHSKWFVENFPYDEKFTKQIRFPGDIWILPGDSSELTFEGYNILGGILDEMDSHKVTENKDYAESGYDTINSRIESRYGKQGLIILIGQMKKSNGFAAKKYKEFLTDPEALVVRQTIWESFGWQNYLKPDGTRDSFFYDSKRKKIIPKEVAELVPGEHIFEVPMVYFKSFDNNPEKALRDLAGIPPKVTDPFISLEDRVDECVERWKENHGDESPVDDNPTRPAFRPWFKSEMDPRRRTLHIDMAVSGNGDALGIAMGHVDSVVEVDDELKPHITIDFLMRIKAMPGTEIMLSEVRQIIYMIRSELRFKLKNVTMDGFQSTDTIQQLRKKKFLVDRLSVDVNTLPYEDLREAIYERRLDFPPYVTYMNKGDTSVVEVAKKELLELVHTGKKVDHPPEGSKDVADAMAGVVTTLMGDRAYRKGVTSLDAARKRRELSDTGTDGSSPWGTGSTTPSVMDGYAGGLTAPIPPSTGGGGLVIPSRLRPRPER
jgi:hypothetical protein